MQGICLSGAIPLRNEPSHRSEMVSQLIFGELFTVLEEDGKWVYVLTEWDSYSAWAERKQMEMVDEQAYGTLLATDKCYAADLVMTVINPAGEEIPVPAGSTLFALEDDFFTIGDKKYRANGKVNNISIPGPETLTAMARKFLNAPYLWGGRTIFGIDCSGFTQIVFKSFGIRLPRDSYQQAKIGKHVNLISEAQPGDLAFFDNDDGNNISHTGIILPEEKILHASGKVRIDRLDHHGIYNLETKSYTHRLRTLSRII
jgi:cell wall-associated NlpC family hydrolase